MSRFSRASRVAVSRRLLLRAVRQSIEVLEQRRLLAVFAHGPANAMPLDCIDTEGVEVDHDHEGHDHDHEGHDHDHGHVHEADEFDNGKATYDDFQSDPTRGSVGSTWGSGTQSLEYSYRNLIDGGLPGGLSAAQIRDIMEEAMLVWTAVAPLRLHEVSEGGSPDHFADWFGPGGRLRFGHEFIDGASGLNVLAHAFQPNIGNAGLGGDVHFDNGNTWNYNGMLATATHEIGHAFGLNHANGDVSGGVCPAAIPAIMDACAGSFSYNGKDSAFLLADDRATMIAAYGGGFGYVQDLSGNIMVAGTELNNTITVSFSGPNLTVSSSGNGSWTRTWAGLSSLIITPRGGVDTVNIDSLPPGMSVSINGGDGNDLIRIGGDNIALIGSNVIVNGGAGTDQIEIEDRSGASRIFNINDSTITNTSSAVFFTYLNTVEEIEFFGSANSDSFNFNGATAELTSVSINGGASTDRLIFAGDIDNVLNVDLFFNGQDGFDRILLDDSADAGADSYTFNTFSFTKSSLAAGNQVRWNGTLEEVWADANNSANVINVLGLQGGMFLEIDGRGGDDTFNVGGTDYDNVMGDDLHLFGDAGIDELVINDSGDTLADNYTLAYDYFAKDADIRTYFVTTERVRVTANDAVNVITVLSTAPAATYTVNGGNGDDTLIVEEGAFGGGTDINGAITVDGGLGDDSLTYRDASTSAASYVISSNSVSRSPSANVTFFSVVAAAFIANDAASTIYADFVNDTLPITVSGGGGNDTLIAGNGDFDGAINGTLHYLGGDGDDSLRVDDSLDNGDETWEINNTSITKSSEPTGLIKFNPELNIFLGIVPQLEAIQILGSNANTTYDVNGVGGSQTLLGFPPNPPVTFYYPVSLNVVAGSGNDTFNVATFGQLSGFVGHVTVTGGAGSDVANINDSADTTGDFITVNGTVLTSLDWDYSLTTSADSITLNAGSGDDTITSTAGGAWTYNGNAGADEFHIQSGINHRIHGNAGLDRIWMNQDEVSLARAFIDQDEDLQDIRLYAGGSLTLTGAQTIDTQEFGFIRGTLDLYKGMMVVRNETATYPPFALDKINRAYNGGGWNGTPAGGSAGVVTSTAAFSSPGFPDAVGFAHIGAGSGQLNVASVGGVTVAANDFVMRYTIAGDANLDRIVNFDDLLLLAQNYNTAGTWAQGDFTYSGNINFDDLLLLAQQYGATLQQGWNVPQETRRRDEQRVAEGMIA